MYHGSRSIFDAFDIKKAGEASTVSSVGFWFAPQLDFADKFTDDVWYGKDGKQIYSVYLNIKNPIIYRTKKTDYELLQSIDKEINVLEKEIKVYLNKYGWNSLVRGQITKKEYDEFSNSNELNGLKEKLNETQNKYDELVFGDAVPVMMGYYAVYKYHYNKLLSEGMNEAEAKKETEIEAGMSSDRSQQAGNIKDTGYLQQQGTFANLFQMFITSQRQYMNALP